MENNKRLFPIFLVPLCVAFAEVILFAVLFTSFFDGELWYFDLGWPQILYLVLLILAVLFTVLYPLFALRGKEAPRPVVSAPSEKADTVLQFLILAGLLFDLTMQLTAQSLSGFQPLAHLVLTVLFAGLVTALLPFWNLPESTKTALTFVRNTVSILWACTMLLIAYFDWHTTLNSDIKKILGFAVSAVLVHSLSQTHYTLAEKREKLYLASKALCVLLLPPVLVVCALLPNGKIVLSDPYSRFYVALLPLLIHGAFCFYASLKATLFPRKEPVEAEKAEEPDPKEPQDTEGSDQ
ncbi:MAG: hypothetical protein IJU20_04735 [Clostridia bacterium]|nr:hypothetical protein [Clostridia bacterium]